MLETRRLNVWDLEAEGMESASSSSEVVGPPVPRALKGNGLFKGCLALDPNFILRDLVVGVWDEIGLEPSGDERGRWSLSMLNMGLTGVVGCLLQFGELKLGEPKSCIPHSRESFAERKMEGFFSFSTVMCFGLDFVRCFAVLFWGMDFIVGGDGIGDEVMGMINL